jgi:hypothetical protein
MANAKKSPYLSYSFVIMVKGMSELVSGIVGSVRGTFENRWARHIVYFA